MNRTTMFRDSRVYFFLPLPLAEGPIVKIGFSNDTWGRFRAHAQYLGGEPIASIRGSRRKESAWHKRFQHLRVPVIGMRELYWLTAELDWAIAEAIKADAPWGRDEFTAWHQHQAVVATIVGRSAPHAKRQDAPIGIGRCGCGALIPPPVMQKPIHQCDSKQPKGWVIEWRP